ncbi:MAG: translation initiation factor IF-2 [Candidatus Marinimicrobia bacterium]|nr:translation initiation factor IF-2 [Candidatus Neomarinimicrobiota bacterium]
MTASADAPVKIFQLAKQLNTSHRDIIEYLRMKGIEASLNKALEPDTLQIVLSHFADEVKKADNLMAQREHKRIAEEDRRKSREEEKINEEAARKKVQEKVLDSLKDKPTPEIKPVEKTTARASDDRTLDKATIQKEKDVKQQAAETSLQLKKEKEERLKAEKEAAEILKKEEAPKDKSAAAKEEELRKKKKLKKGQEEEVFENKLEKLKARHKHATKRIQVSEMDSRLERFRQSKNIEDLETVAAAGVKRRSKKKKAVDQVEVNKSIRATLASMGDKPKKKKYRTRQISAEEGYVDDGVLEITEYISVDELSKHLNVAAVELIGKCMQIGLMVTINQRLDWDTIELLASEYNVEVRKVKEYTEEIIDEDDEYEDYELIERPPVVTVMGHVDHGKTSILDYIRKTRVVDDESGGITQHIGAYSVETAKGKKITFLDTPGHEAFTAMRARGAQVTDIVVVVVAADDGVMPQTQEAINHAHAAGVPIIIAINKMDKPDVDPERVVRELSEKNVLVEAWGGSVQSVRVSAKTGLNMDALLDAILLEAEVLELKSTPEGDARGIVIESQLDKGLGAIATVLINRGTLRIGDAFICGRFAGKVRAMMNEFGERIETAKPADPIQIQGFDSVPQSGDRFIVMDDEREARRIANERQIIHREQEFRSQSLQTLDEIGRQIAEGRTRELALIIKGDVDGSIEAFADSFLKLSTKEVAVNVIHRGIGMINETDINLASASRAVIVGFHVNATGKALELARERNVEIRNYTVIYDAVEDVRLALEGLLEPDKVREVLGTSEVRQLIRISKVGVVAGSIVTKGVMKRNTTIRILRGGEEIFKGYLTSIKRFKDDVKEVQEGYECGIYIDSFDDFHEGDIVESYVEKAVKRKLEANK